MGIPAYCIDRTRLQLIVLYHLNIAVVPGGASRGVADTGDSMTGGGQIGGHHGYWGQDVATVLPLALGEQRVRAR